MTSSSPQPLPARPNLDQLRKQAKELQTTERFSTLASAQHALARRYGFEAWPKLKLAVESQTLRRLIQERNAKGVMFEFKAVPRVFGLMILVAWGFWRDRLRARLSEDPSLVESRGEWGTLLNAAAYNGQIDSARILLEFGADKTARNAAGLTPTEMAAARGHGELAKLLA